MSTSDINMLLTGYFPCFGPSSVNPLWRKIPVDHQLRYSVYPIRLQQPIIKWPFFLHSDAEFELQQAVFTTSTCLNALSSCHVICWFDNCINEQLNRCTKQSLFHFPNLPFMYLASKVNSLTNRLAEFKEGFLHLGNFHQLQKHLLCGLTVQPQLNTVEMLVLDPTEIPKWRKPCLKLIKVRLSCSRPGDVSV